MAQRNIDFGSFPDDPSADAIRTAFQKVQENFDELFSGITSQTVQSVNQTPGAGISVNQPKGNVVVSAKIACVQVQSSTLGLSVGSGPLTNFVVIEDGSTPLTIELPANIEFVQAVTVYDTVTANTIIANQSVSTTNLVVSNSATMGNTSINGRLIVTGNANVGNVNSGNGRFTGNLSAVNFTGTNLALTGNANLGNVVRANFFIGDGRFLTNVPGTGNTGGGSFISNGSSNIAVDLNGSARITIDGTSNVFVVGVDTATMNGSFTASGTITGNALIGATLESTAPQGTAPIKVASNTVVANLNAQYVDGFSANAQATGNTLVARDINGNVTANYFIGDGSKLTGIPGGTNLANGTSNVSIPEADGKVNISASGVANIVEVTVDGLTTNGNLQVNGSANIASITTTIVTAELLEGTLITSAQPNITSIGTLDSLTVTGEANVGSLTTNELVVTDRVTALQFEATTTDQAPLLVNSQVKVANLNAELLDGRISTTEAVPDTVVIRDASGNVTANYFIGDGSKLTGIAGGSGIANGISNVAIPVENGPIVISSDGIDNVFSVSRDTMTMNGNALIAGNLAVEADLNADGNISSAGNLELAQNANVGKDLNVLGNANVAGEFNAVGNAILGADLTVAGNSLVQGNSNVSGEFGVIGNVTAQASANIYGNLDVGGSLNVAQESTVLGNSFVLGNSSVAGNSLVSGNLDVALDANIVGNLSVSGNLEVDLDTLIAGNASVLGNFEVVQDANVLGNASVSGNLVVQQDANVIGNVTANHFIGDGSLLTGIVASSIDAGNVVGLGEVALLNLNGNPEQYLNGVGDFAPVSVNASSITGLGNIATINLDGSSGNVLYGNGVFAPSAGGIPDAPVNGLYYARRNGQWVSFQPSSGSDGTGALQLLYTNEVTVPSANVMVYNVPEGYKDLIFVISGTSTADNAELYMYVNSDTNSNYDSQAWSAFKNTIALNTNLPRIGRFEGPLIQQGLNATPVEITLLNYSSQTQTKRAFSFHSYAFGEPGSENFFGEYNSWAWKNIAPVTQIQFSLRGALFNPGTVIRVYGRGGIADGGHGASGVDWINPPKYPYLEEDYQFGDFNYSLFADGAGIDWFNGSHAYEAWRTDPGAPNENLLGFVGKPVPVSSEWAATMGMQPISLGEELYYQSGLTLVNSLTEQAMGVYMNTNGPGEAKLSLCYFSALDSAPVFLGEIADVDFNTSIWFKVMFDGTAYTFSVSFSYGDYWIPIGSPLAVENYFVADKVGLGMQSFGQVDPTYFRADVSYYVDPDHPFYGGLNPNIISNGESNVWIPIRDGNVTVGIDGTPNVVVISKDDATFAGNVTVLGNINGKITTTPGEPIIIDSGGNGQVNIISQLTTISNNFSVEGNSNFAGDVTIAGTMTAGYLVGNGALLTGLPGGAYIANGNSNISIMQEDGPIVITSGANAGITANIGKTGFTLTSGNFQETDPSGPVSITSAGRLDLSGRPGFTLRSTSRAGGQSGDGTIQTAGNLNISVGGFTEFSVGAFANLNGNIRLGGALTVADQRDALFTGDVNINGNTTINGNLDAVLVTVTQPYLTSVSDEFDHLTLKPTGYINGGNLVSANYIQGDGYLLTNISVAAGTYILNGNSNVFVDTDGNVRFSVNNVSNVFEVSSTDSTFATNLTVNGNTLLNGDAEITGMVNVTGNVSAGYLFGNGALLTGLPGGSFVSNGNSNINIAEADGNILMFSANGNVDIKTGANGSYVNFVVNSANILSMSNTKATFDSPVQISNEANVLGNLAVAGNLTARSLTTSGNVSADYLIGDGGFISNLAITAGTYISAGLSNVAIEGNNGGITLYSAAEGNILMNATNGGAINIIANGPYGQGSSSSDINIKSDRGAITIQSNTSNKAMTISTGNRLDIDSDGNLTVRAPFASWQVPTSNVTGNMNINGRVNITGNIQGNGSLTLPSGNVTAEYFFGNLNIIQNETTYVSIPQQDGGITMSSTQNGDIVAIADGEPETGNISITSRQGTALFGGGANVTIQSTGLANVVSDLRLRAPAGNVLVTVGSVANVLTIANVSNVVSTTIKGNLKADFFVGDGRYLTNLTVEGGSFIALGDSNVYIDGPNGSIYANTYFGSDIIMTTRSDNFGEGNIEFNASNGSMRFSANNVSNVMVIDGDGVTITNLDAPSIVSEIIEGTLTTHDQPNIYSVGNLTALTVIGDTLLSNLFVGADANVTGNVNVTGNITVAPNSYIIADGSQLYNLPALAVGNIANGNSNVDIATANGNVTVGVGGNANVLIVTSTGVNVTGTLNATGTTTANRLNVANLSVSGNIINDANFSNDANIGGTLRVSGTANITGPLRVTGNANLANLSVSGTFTSNGNLSGSNISTTGSVTSVNGLVATSSYSDAFTNGVVIDYASGNARFSTGQNAGFRFFNQGVGNVSLLSIDSGGNGTFNGNVTAQYLFGDGSQLTGLPGGTGIANGTSNIRIIQDQDIIMSSNGVAGVVTVYGNGANVSGNLIASGNITAGSGSNGSIIGANLVSATYLEGTLITQAQPNIRSVGTLIAMTSSGNVTGANVISTGFTIRSVGTGIEAAGTTQADATPITKEINVISSGTSTQGVVLPSAIAGMSITITNTALQAINVYPATGAQINSLGLDSAFTLDAGKTTQFVAPGVAQWYSVG